MTERPTHWLRLNAASRTPRRVICFDSEAVKVRTRHTETQRFRLAVASFDRLDADANAHGLESAEFVGEPLELWKWVADHTAQSHKTVCFAHKLDYDLRLTDGLRHLPGLGFKCKGIGLNPHSTWARFSDGKRSLWLCDSLTFLPASLDKIAAMIKAQKKPLPADNAPDAAWLARCRGDVEVLRAAILHYIGFVKREDLGDFRLTGSAQASAAFRHRFLQPKTLLVHSDQSTIDAERRAAFAGRCEVWRHGKVKGPIYEYDFQASYARIAERYAVPCRSWGEHTLLPPHRLAKVRQHSAILCDVTVTTDVPTVPAPLDGRIVWPVGTFTTTLWDCELDLLESEGGSYEITRLWTYDRAPILRDWARWILDGLDGKPPGDVPLQQLVLKHWSRALIGRFGLRYPVLEEFGTDSEFGLSLMPVWDDVTQTNTTHLQLGQQVFEQVGTAESGNSAPMVMSWIMAKARCELWELMKVAGLDNVLYVDTDGILLATKSFGPKLSLAVKGMTDRVRLKQEFSSADLRSPRNLDVGDERRIAGLPRKAQRNGRDTYQGEVWESLPTALRKRRASTVVLTERRFTVADRDPRRNHLPGGATAPLYLDRHPERGHTSHTHVTTAAAPSAP